MNRFDDDDRTYQYEHIEIEYTSIVSVQFRSGLGALHFLLKTSEELFFNPNS